MSLRDILRNQSKPVQDALSAFDDAPAAADIARVPAGEYECVVAAIKMTESRNGVPLCRLVLRITTGDYEGQLLFSDNYLSHDAMPLTKRKLSAIGFSTAKQLTAPLQNEVYVNVRVVQQVGDDGTTYTKVTDYRHLRTVVPKPDPFALCDPELPSPSSALSESQNLITNTKESLEDF